MASLEVEAYQSEERWISDLDEEIFNEIGVVWLKL